MSVKKLLGAFVFLFSAVAILNSCTPDEPEKEFDRNLLIGKWASGSLYYRYDADGAGATWNTADDVTEEEGQKYTWTLVKSELTRVRILEIGGSIPKIYIVKTLTATDLSYEDDFGKAIHFKKQ